MTVEKTKTTSILLFVFRCIPLWVRKGFFWSIFFLFYHLVSKSRLIVLHNLQRSFPQKDSMEIEKIAKGVYRHFSIVAAEFFDLTSITRDNIDQWVEVEGMEYAKEVLAMNKGALSIVAHFGNWELLTIAIPMLVKPMHIVYRPLDSTVFDNLVEYVRTLHGNSLIPKGGSGKKVLELLKEEQIIGILSDQNVAAYEGVFVDFFGRPACTGVGLAVMALRSGSPVVPVFMARQKSGKYKLIFKPPVEVVSTGHYEADLVTNTQRFTKMVEDVVREYPDQWFWFHQRWKTKKHQK